MGVKAGLDWPLLGGSQVSKARPGAPFACPGLNGFGAFESFRRLFSRTAPAWADGGLTACVRTAGLQNQSRRACPELVERGRLNLAQDAVLGIDSRDEKSRRDDWKLPAGNPAQLRISDPLPRIQDRVSILFSRPCGTLRSRMTTQDCVLG